MIQSTDMKIKATVYKGKSKHPVLKNWDEDCYAYEITSDEAKTPWWKHRRPGLMKETFSDLVWELFSHEKGQSMLAEVCPEADFLKLSELENNRAWLNEQIKSNPSVGKKTLFPSEMNKWPEDVFYKQYLFEVDERNQLLTMFELFSRFEMMNIWLFNVDAKIDQCAHQLQQGYMGKPFHINQIVEPLNVLIYCGSYGDNLIIESPDEHFVERFLNERNIEPTPAHNHPFKIKYGFSMWSWNK